MRNLILSKNLSVPAIFFFLLCVKGGELAAWIMDKTNLSVWLEANKLGNTFSGADFSMLPAIAVMAGMYAVSYWIFLIVEMVFEIYDGLTTAPESSRVTKSEKPAVSSPESREQAEAYTPSENNDEQEKS